MSMLPLSVVFLPAIVLIWLPVRMLAGTYAGNVDEDADWMKNFGFVCACGFGLARKHPTGNARGACCCISFAEILQIKGLLAFISAAQLWIGFEEVGF